MRYDPQQVKHKRNCQYHFCEPKVKAVEVVECKNAQHSQIGQEVEEVMSNKHPQYFAAEQDKHNNQYYLQRSTFLAR